MNEVARANGHTSFAIASDNRYAQADDRSKQRLRVHSRIEFLCLFQQLRNVAYQMLREIEARMRVITRTQRHDLEPLHGIHTLLNGGNSAMDRLTLPANGDGMGRHVATT